MPNKAVFERGFHLVIHSNNNQINIIMNVQNENGITPEQLSEILLVLDKEKMKIQAVKGIGANGELETVDPLKKNQNQFMRVDKNGDILSNFFSNFISQIKNPTNFSFFKVPEAAATDIASKIQKHVDDPTQKGEGSKLMDDYEVKAELHQEKKEVNKSEMDSPSNPKESKEFRFNSDQIDWETMNNLGLGKERLEKIGVLDSLLSGYKTNELVPISINLGTAVTRMDARLSLQQNDEGQVVVAIHGIRKEPNLNFEFFGHKFTDQDKKNLLETGNMGRVVDLKNTKTGELIPSIISVDRLTNEIIALRTEFIKIPDDIKGLKLDDPQKQALGQGKPLYLEGMLSKKGSPFDATIQFNADKRYVEFLFDKSSTNKESQSTKETHPIEVPKSFRGKELDTEQYDRLKNGQTVYLSGLIDKKGETYQGYITYNKETNKTDFAFKNPNKIKEQVQPIEAHKTQKAVNSDGKTNEATKHSKKSLKSAQNNPDNTKEKATKSKSRKM